MRTLRRLVREAAGTVLADLEHVAVTVEHVVDDLEEQAELARKGAPRRVLGHRHLGSPEAAHHRSGEERTGLQRMEASSGAPPSRSICWPPIIASVASTSSRATEATG